MFFSRRNLRPSGRKQRPSKRPFRPMLESLEDRITPSQTVDVAAPGSGGAASLVTAVKDANAYTGGGTFTINLQTGTYSLDTPFDGADPGSALVLNNTTAETTIILKGTGAGGAAGTTITTTALERLLQVDPGTNVILENVAITNGKAVDDGFLSGRPQSIVTSAGPLSAAGGGMLNLGGTVSMSNVSFTGNSADGSTSFTFHGGTSGGAGGGAIFSTGGTLNLASVTFTNNLAVGGQGGTESAHHQHSGDGGGEGPSFTPPPSGIGFPGGFAIGGAIAAQNTTINVVQTIALPNNPTPPLPVNFPLSTLTSPLLEATGNMAQGGNGGDGVSFDHAGGDGGEGGVGEGGAIWLEGGTANLVAISLSDNTAQGGKGGNGGSGDSGGTGGDGGFAAGGGLFITTAAGDTPATVYVAGSDIGPDAMSGLGNSAVAGNGGAGGDSTGTIGHQGVTGGNGGNGGFAEGGGAAFVDGATLHMVNDTVANNLAQGGNGAVGGQGGPGGGHVGGTGGVGGNAGSATGGGIHISFGDARLTNITVVFNTAASGSVGVGGPGGTSFGGAQGASGLAATLTDAGGIDSAPPGPPIVSVPDVIMTNDLVALNQVENPGTAVLTPQNDLEGAITVPLIISPTITGSFNYIGTLNLPTTGIGTSSFVQLLTSQAINGNLIGGLNAPANPLLASSIPINNGGPTFSILPSANSPVIDKGTPSVATEIGGSTGNLGQAQNGVLRTTGVDIGSTQFSVQSASLVFTFTGSPSTFLIGNPSSLPVTVQISDPNTGPVSGGFVTFIVTGPGASTTVVGNSGPIAVNSSGQASDADIILTSPLTPGTYTVTAKYSNSSGTFTSTGTEMATATGAGTSVSPGSTSATAGVGGDVSVSATVLSALGGTVNEGTVSFTVIVNTATGPQTVTATSGTVTGGVAGPVTLLLPTNVVAGSYSIAETYTDGTDFTTSTANGTLTVSNPPPSPPPPIPNPLPITVQGTVQTQTQVVSPPAPTPVQLFIDGIILAYDLSQPGGVSTVLANKGLVSDLMIAGLLNPFVVAGYDAAHGIGSNAFVASSTSGSSI